MIRLESKSIIPIDNREIRGLVVLAASTVVRSNITKKMLPNDVGPVYHVEVKVILAGASISWQGARILTRLIFRRAVNPNP
jgi:hypothetical protein